MNATQAPAGGELHKLSDKFYEGGQFMPAQDVMAGTKRKAEKAAAKYTWFSDPRAGAALNGKIPIFAEAYGRTKLVCSVDTEKQAEAVVATLREMIEARLGGGKLNWD